MWSYISSMFSSSTDEAERPVPTGRADDTEEKEETPTDTTKASAKSTKEGMKPPPLAKHDSTTLDLAFVMDCTGSMGSYINSARDNIRKIVEDIVAYEKSNVNIALVEYRDHPPQDSSFVTRPHDFSPKIGNVKSWLDECSASGGGDGPEAVADGLHQLLKLSWRKEATKIAVLIADAPPHGLGGSGDGFPNGCPDGLDPMEITHEIAERGITLYVVGCEPSLYCYKNFFMGLAYVTGGQYVPLAGAKALSQVIIGGAQEEMSLEQWMEEVNMEVQTQVQAKGADAFDQQATAQTLLEKWTTRGVEVRHLQSKCDELRAATAEAKEIASMKNLADIRKNNPTLAPTSGSSASPSDEYVISTLGIDLNQAKRMVQRSKMRNKSLFS